MQTLCTVLWYDIARGIGMVALDTAWFGIQETTIHTDYQLTRGGRYCVEVTGGRKRPILALRDLVQAAE